jgi:hypothetical protein
MAIFRPARRLKRADFPTLGRPTMATVGMPVIKRRKTGERKSAGRIGGLRGFCRLYPVFCGLPRLVLFVLPFCDIKRKRIANIRNPKSISTLHGDRPPTGG